MDSPAMDATPAQTNYVDETELADEEAVLDPSPEDLGLVVDEAATPATGGETMETEEVEQDEVNGDDQDQDTAEPKTNGINHDEPEAAVESDADGDAEPEPEIEPPQTPEKKGTSASKSPTAASQKAKARQSDQHIKTPQSVNRKALVEKIQVVVSAEPESGRRRNSKIGATDTNGIDSDVDAEGEDDIDGEYEVDGDVMMET